MRIGLAAKLFLAVLTACAVVLLVNGVAAQLSFQRGFLGYLNEQGAQRMEMVVPRLANAYRAHRSWEFLRGDLKAWFELMRPDPDPGRASTGPPIPDQTGAVARFSLLDPDYGVVIGHPAAVKQSILRPVIVDGKTVGWMAMIPFEKAIASYDVRFYEAQRQMWWLIGGLSVLVAVVLAGLLSRTLVRRVYALMAATRQLVAGKYATRVDIGARDELDELGGDFNRMAEALEHNERARRLFMADISHELRTPLAVIRAEVEAIQDGIRPMNPAALNPVEEQIARLGKLLDDLHDLSLTDVGTLAYRRVPLDLAPLLDATLGAVQDRYATAQLQLSWRIAPGPLRVDGDERRLQQLFANLLENSLRYTDRHGRVEVQCERQDGGGFRITFDDSAPSVDAQHLQRLFERFYRVEASRRRATGGSGLGLAICRNIVSAHDGSIRADPSPLGGLRITIDLLELA